MIKKIEMATRLLYNGPLSSEFESMALYKILHCVNIKYSTNHTQVTVGCWQTPLNQFINEKKSVLLFSCPFNHNTHFGHPSKVDMVKRASMPLRMLSKFRSALAHSRLQTSISCNAPS